MSLTFANLLWPLDYGPLLCVTMVPCLTHLYCLGLKWSFVSLHCRIHEARFNICLLYHIPCVWHVVEIWFLSVLVTCIFWRELGNPKKEKKHIYCDAVPLLFISLLCLFLFLFFLSLSSSFNSSVMEVISLAYLLDLWTAVEVDCAGKAWRRSPTYGWSIKKITPSYPTQRRQASLCGRHFTTGWTQNLCIQGR